MASEKQEPPPSGGDDSSAEDDAWADEFARDFEAMREKVARIPDDIGEKLDALLNQGNAGARTPAPQSRGTSQQRGAPQRQFEPQQPTAPAIPEKKPKSTHWYFRERGRRDG